MKFNKKIDLHKYHIVHKIQIIISYPSFALTFIGKSRSSLSRTRTEAAKKHQTFMKLKLKLK